MPSIELQIPTGPGTTRRAAFAASPVRFGREADNHVVLTEPTASRHHGELRFEGGRWWLVNLSPNGTNVNGRRVTGKAEPLSGREVVAIGDARIFAVAAAPMEAAPEAAEARPERGRERAGAPRSRLWVGIGAWWLLVLGVIAFMSFNSESEGPAPAPELTGAQIERDVTRPVRVDTADPREADVQLAAAREYASKLDASPANLYRAYRAYQLALAHRQTDVFPDGLDQRRYLDLQRQLVDRVTTLYTSGYEQLRSGQHRRALDTFNRLNGQVYPDPSGAVYQNAESQRSAAAAALKRKRGS